MRTRLFARFGFWTNTLTTWKMESGMAAATISSPMMPPSRRGGTNVLEVLLTGAAIGASVYALTRIHVLEERVRQLSSTSTTFSSRPPSERSGDTPSPRTRRREEEETVHEDRESSDESDDEEGPPPPEGGGAPHPIEDVTPPPPSMTLRRGRRSDS